MATDVSKFARVITYDRAGLGWSEPSPHKRDSNRVVHELHTLLTSKGVSGPIILVGHSFGGVSMQLYALKHPEQVVGLVLVDAAHEQQIAKMPASNVLQKNLFKLAILAAPLGLPRLYLSDKNAVEHAKKSTTKHQYTILAESNAFVESLQQLRALNTDLGDLPLRIIARNH